MKFDSEQADLMRWNKKKNTHNYQLYVKWKTSKSTFWRDTKKLSMIKSKSENVVLRALMFLSHKDIKRAFFASSWQIIWSLHLPGDARRSPVRAAGSLRAVSTVIEGPQRTWTVWWWRGSPGSRTLARWHPPGGSGAGWRRPGAGENI